MGSMLCALVILHVNLPKCYIVGDVSQAIEAGGTIVLFGTTCFLGSFGLKPAPLDKLEKEIIGITITIE